MCPGMDTVTIGRRVPVTMNYSTFYQREFSRMVSLACTICSDYQQGEDVAQEALARAHRHWDQVSGYDKPGAWLRRVTINLSLSRMRRVKREVVALRQVASERSGIGAEPLIGHTGFDHEVWDAVRRLPPRQRAVVALFYQEDMSTSDIASTLECTVSTATSHLNQARRSLAELLETAATGNEENQS